MLGILHQERRTMADRLTDKFTKAFAAAAHAISVYTRANQGLPMIMVKADSIPAVTTRTPLRRPRSRASTTPRSRRWN